MPDFAATPHAAGVVLIDDDGCVLLLERPDGTWTIPGGIIDPGETPEEAAKRECHEECGYIPINPGLVGNYDGFVVFRQHISRFDPQISNEHKAFLWIDPEQVSGERQYFLLTETIISDATGSQRSYDLNGWFEVRDNPISRSGVFPYSGASLGIEGREDEIFYVLRPPEELGSAECIASFRLLPFVDDHTFIGPVAQAHFPTALPAEQKGIGGVIGEAVYFRDGVLYGNLKVYSDSLASLIAAGKKELSAGYTCRYEECSGVWEGQPYQYVQRDIRGNHLALVDEGRMGPMVAVLDWKTPSAFFNFACDKKEFVMKKKKFSVAAVKAATGKMRKALDAAEEAGNSEISIEQLSKILLENMPRIHEMLAVLEGKGTPSTGSEVLDEENKEIEDEEENGEDEEMKKGDASLTGDQESETPEAPPVGTNKNGINETKASGEDRALLKRLTAEIAALKAAQDSSEKTFIRQQTQRASVASRLQKIVGVFDHSEMTLKNIVDYGVKKLNLTPQKGHEYTALDAYMSAIEATGANRPAVYVGLDGRGNEEKKYSVFDAAFSE